MELGQARLGTHFQVVRSTLRTMGLLLAAAILFAAAKPMEGGQVPGPLRVPPQDPRFLWMGRVAAKGEYELRLGYPGVTLRFAYRGPAPTLLLGASTATCYFNLTCNGWDPVLIHSRKGRSEVLLPSGSAPASGWVVELTRRTENWQGVASFHGLELPPGCELLAPPPLPERRLLVIGDSISCGDKIDRLPPDFDESPRNSNAPRSYGMLLGHWLGAQVHLVAVGGRGLTRDWRGRSDVANAPQFFPRALPEEPDAHWDHASYQPDAVLIGLGTNDFNGTLPEASGFMLAYDRFLIEVRKAHPKAALILLESPVFGEEPGTLDRQKRDLLRLCLDGVVALRKTAGDARVIVAPLHKQPGTASDAHPVAFQHEQIARELLPVVKVMTGW